MFGHFRNTLVFGLACLVCVFGGCRQAAKNSQDQNPEGTSISNKEGFAGDNFTGNRQPFDIFWPPSLEPKNSRRKPLLSGNLCWEWGQGNELLIHVELSRPADEESRKRWNRQMAFPEYSWMSKVRVWDNGKKWIWPNLQCLLTAHGRQRHERYGGIDPGKGVDNDYAALWIQKLDNDGRPVTEATHSSLVSAEWYANDTALSGRITAVSHQAHSDRLAIPLITSDASLSNEAIKPTQKIGVWLIYADFLDADPSKSWPREKEFAGGILAYFELTCETMVKDDLSVAVKQLIPRYATGFDWRKWSTAAAPFQKKLK